MNLGLPFVADAQPAKLMQPGDRALDHPAGAAKAAPMLGVAARNLGGDAAGGQARAMGIGVVAAVGLHAVGFALRCPRFAGDGRDRLHERQQLGDVVAVGLGQDHRKGKALGVREEVVFRAGFTAIGRVRSSFFPAPTARIEEESAMAREKSMRSAARSLESSKRCSRSHTPASCQALSRRQQVIPDPQPISLGSISQGIPDRKTNRIPVSARRLSIGFRPGCRLRRRLGGGSRGSITAHKSSLTSGRGISCLLAVGGDTTECRIDFSFC